MKDKKSEALYNALLEIFFTDTIGSCHVETAVEFLERLPSRQIGPVLKLVRLISGSVSDLLAFCFMENVENGLKYLSVRQLEEWVTDALGIYEARGLQAAKDFLSNPAETTLRYSSSKVVLLHEAASDMRLLAAGLSRRDVHFDSASLLATNTETIFAPSSCAIFNSREENQLFYRVAIVHKCAQIRYNSFLMPLEQVFSEFSHLFTENEEQHVEKFGFLAFMNRLRSLYPGMDMPSLYCLFDTIRIENVLLNDYQGLSRNFSLLKEKLRAQLNSLPVSDSRDGKGLLWEICLWILNDYQEKFLPGHDGLIPFLLALRSEQATSLDSARTLCAYSKIQSSTENNPAGTLLPYIGTVDLSGLDMRLQERRRFLEKSFIDIVGALLAERDRFNSCLQDENGEDKKQRSSCAFSSEEDGGLAFIAVPEGKEEAVVPEFLENLVLEASADVREQLSEIVREICHDLGRVPASYVSTALDLATGAYDSSINVEYGADEKPVFTFYSYPEWDFRRSAYRKNWCTVKEMLCPSAKGNFVSMVLEKYRGQLAALRRQFELMRQDYRYERRQRYGEEIDIDAYVEARADIMACLSPSEYLYTRLVKDQRDIAVLFLIDMSASTQGWINTAIKESLVLLTHAMELLGDRYAIYGFSGMQRTGCQSFVIKEFDQDG